MSYLDKLLDGAKVELKPLGEAIKIQRGRRLVKSQLEKTGSYAVYQNSMTPLGFYHEGNVKKDTTFVICAGAAGEIGYSDSSFWAADDVHYLITPDNIVNKFAYYFLLTQQHIIKGQVRRASIPRLSKSVIEKLQIPIPPLAVQEEIVRILDTFTELTAELTARKKQYSYYREELFNFEENEVQYFPMGDESIGKFIRGGGLQKKDFTESGVGCIHYGQIYTYYRTHTNKTKTFVSEEFAKKARMAKCGDLVIATTSENDEDVCKAVAWLGKEKIAVSSDACFYQHNLNPKYVAYFFETEQFQKQKMPFITGAKVRRVNADSLAKINIPVPSPEEQERIVSILDKFDTLATSISEGLPKEIDLRQKQYEYYRDKLLSF